MGKKPVNTFYRTAEGCYLEAFHPAICSTEIYASPKVTSTFNLGMGGTRIETPYSFILGTGLEMSIAIRPKVIKCRGRVVHVQYGDRLEAGVQFEDLSEQDRLYLEEYLSCLRE